MSAPTFAPRARGGFRRLLAASAVLATAAALGSAEMPRYPLKLSENRRHLVDQDNRPFFINGDAAWSLLTAVTKPEAEQYLDNRRALGITTLIVNLVEHKFNGPANRDGAGPFLVAGDFAQPNEKYFQHADWVLRKAAEKGFTLLLAPCYLGYKGMDEGWYHEINACGPEKMLRYGRFVGERYRDLKNVIWMLGGDRDPGEAREEVRAVAQGLREFIPDNLFTAHCEPEQSPADGYRGESWVQVNNTYTYTIVHRKLMADYRRQPAIPTFLIESTYEGEHNATPQQIRRQAYWAPLCGGSGHVMGNRPIWLFDPGWQEAINGQASQDMARFRAFFESRAWATLVPLHDKIVTRGIGEWNGLDFAAAARTEDRATIIVYLPTARTIEVNLAELSGAEARAWWFDPRTGAAQDGGTFPTKAGQKFTPPADGDWALVLDDAARRLPPPGTVAKP